MDSSKLSIKLYAREGQDPSVFDAGVIVPVFHSWIQARAVPDHLLIDVADYAHVPDGPGTVLVSHEANFSTDRTEGRPGLLYVRKQPLEGSLGQRLRTVLAAALSAAVRLEEHPSLRGKLHFRTDEFLFRVHDRLLAPNTPRTLEQVKPELERLAAELYPGGPVSLEYQPSDLTLFGVRVKATAPQAPDPATLLGRLRAEAATA